MNHNDPNQETDDLDQQIKAALQVEQSPQQVARLTDFWQQQSRSEIRRRHIRRVAALATAIAAMVAVSVSVRLWRQEPTQHPLEVNRPTAAVAVTPNSIHDDAPQRDVPQRDVPQRDVPQRDVPQRDVVDKPTIEEKSLSAGRPATTYERFLFAVHTRKPVAQRRPSVVAMVATVDKAIEQLCRDPDTDVEQLAESFGPMGGNAQRLLLRRLLRSNDDQKHAVLRLLAVCGTPQSTQLLLRLGRREAFRDEALATLQRIVGVERLADVVGRTTDRRVRAAILSRMLTADPKPALRSFLALIHDDAIRGEALAVADANARPLLGELLTLLEDEDESVRISAAVVLGHVNGPEVTDSLIARVTQESPPPSEAWIALLACRGARAEEFFAYATRQPKLLGQVNLARVWWARTTP